MDGPMDCYTNWNKSDKDKYIVSYVESKKCYDPEGWYGEGGGRRVQDGEHMYNFFLIKKKKKRK